MTMSPRKLQARQRQEAERPRSKSRQQSVPRASASRLPPRVSSPTQDE